MLRHYWSPSTGGFYNIEIHGVPGEPGCGVPADAVTISAELYRRLLEGVHAGRRIVAGKGGKPRLCDPPAPSAERLLAGARAWRTKRIAATDWTQLADVRLSEAQRAAAADYRQALRDYPARVAAGDYTRPEAPDFLR